jgi:hypothetical protein
VNTSKGYCDTYQRGANKNERELKDEPNKLFGASLDGGAYPPTENRNNEIGGFMNKVEGSKGQIM